MKYGIIVLLLSALWIPGWGQSVDEFKFVSILYPAITSFNKVEVKNKAEFTQGVFNVGSHGGTSGTISIKGDPIKITNLSMHDGTTLEIQGSNWLVDTLKIRPGGNVTVAQLIAGEVVLNNSDVTSLLVKNQQEGKGLLSINGDLYTKEGTVWETLDIEKEGDKEFHFTHPSLTEQEKKATKPEATWQACPVEGACPAGVYPIYTKRDD